MADKFFLKSKTVLGLIVLGASAFGYVLPFTEGEASEVLALLEKVVGIVLIIWGRATATQPLGFGFSK